MKSAPASPNSTKVSEKQQGYNIGAAGAQQNVNMVNQSNPFGSLNYSQIGTNPDGTPKFQATQQYSEPIQRQMANLFGQMNSGDITGQQMDLYSKYYQPLIDQDQRKLDTKLYNQGLQPGSGDGRAYDNAQNLFARNVGDQRDNWLLNSLQATNLPYQQLQSLAGLGGGGFVNTPTAQVQPPNYMGQVNQNYTNQLNASNAWNTGMFNLGSAAIGGFGKAFGAGMV